MDIFLHQLENEFIYVIPSIGNTKYDIAVINRASVFLAAHNSTQQKFPLFHKTLTKYKITVFLKNSHMMIDILNAFSMERLYSSEEVGREWA